MGVRLYAPELNPDGRLEEASGTLARGRELAQANGEKELTLTALIKQARELFSRMGATGYAERVRAGG
jgi:hypothetical protein